MTAAAISKTNLLGMFTVFKEIIQLSGLSTLNSRFSSSASSNHYYEYDPLVSGLRTEGYPCIIIESSASEEAMTMQEVKNYEYTVRVTIRVQFSARGSSSEPYSQAKVNSYAQEIIQYLNTNEATIGQTYNVHVKRINSPPSDVPMLNDEKICERVIEFDCYSYLDVVE